MGEARGSRSRVSPSFFPSFFSRHVLAFVGFDGVFVVPHADEWKRPAAAKGSHWFHPGLRHPFQTWARYAAAVRGARDRGLGDESPIEWFAGRRPGDGVRFRYVAWGEQDQALLQRPSNAELVAAVDGGCGAPVGAACPWRGVAFPPALGRRSLRKKQVGPLAPEQRFASDMDLVWNVSCCVPGTEADFDRALPETPPTQSANDAATRTASLKGVDFFLARDVKIESRRLPVSPCTPRRTRTRRLDQGRLLFDDCRYANT